VKFAHGDSASAAIEQRNRFPLGTKLLKVSLARFPSSEIRNCKLYVTNLPRSLREDDLNVLFSQVLSFKRFHLPHELPYYPHISMQFGTIIEIRVLKDSTGLSKGVAFIQFSVRAEAERGILGNETWDKHKIFRIIFFLTMPSIASFPRFCQR